MNDSKSSSISNEGNVISSIGGRKLATIRRVGSIRSIPEADSIVCAEIGGWKAVVQKGQFEEGELVIYVEIDSWVPIQLAPFLQRGEKTFFNEIEGERIKTMKMRGQLSQGLVLDLKNSVIMQCLSGLGVPPFDALLNQDVSGVLGIQKWEPLNLNEGKEGDGGNGLLPFPTFLHRTEQERVQNLVQEIAGWSMQSSSAELEACATPGTTLPVSWEVTEKVDGSSMTVFIRDDDVGICSRNCRVPITLPEDTDADVTQIEEEVEEEVDNSKGKGKGKGKGKSKSKGKSKGPGDAFLELARREDLIGKLRSLNRNIAVQGEMLGPGVQGNPYKLPHTQFFCFDIFDIDRGQYIDPVARRQLCQQMGLNHVPLVSEDRVLGSADGVASILEEAEGPSVLYPKAEREGLVFKANLTEHRISFKSISNKFLLKHGG